MIYTISKATVLNVGRLRDFHILDAKKRGIEMTADDRKFAKLVFGKSTDKSRIIRVALLCTWAKLSRDESFCINLEHPDLIWINDSMGLLKLQDVTENLAVNRHRREEEVEWSVFHRLLVESEPIILEAERPGKELILRTSVEPEALKSVKKTVAIMGKHSTQTKAVAKANQTVSEARHTLTTARQQAHESTAAIGRQTLSEALQYAKLVRDWRRMRRSIELTWEKCWQETWMPQEHRDIIAEKMEALTKARQRSANYKPRYSYSRVAQDEREKRRLAVCHAENNARFYITSAFDIYMRDQDDDIGWSADVKNTYFNNRYAHHRAILKRWPVVEKTLTTAFRAALSDYSRETTKLESIITVMIS